MVSEVPEKPAPTMAMRMNELALWNATGSRSPV